MSQPKTEHLLQNCLFFTTGKLDRVLPKWAEEEFAVTGLAPSAAFAVMVVNDHPGMNQNELAEILALAPSTLTRFLDKLEARNLVLRQREGRVTFLQPTPGSLELHPILAEGWKRIWTRYNKILGTDSNCHFSENHLPGSKTAKSRAWGNFSPHQPNQFPEKSTIIIPYPLGVVKLGKSPPGIPKIRVKRDYLG